MINKINMFRMNKLIKMSWINSKYNLILLNKKNKMGINKKWLSKIMKIFKNNNKNKIKKIINNIMIIWISKTNKINFRINKIIIIIIIIIKLKIKINSGKIIININHNMAINNSSTKINSLIITNNINKINKTNNSSNNNKIIIYKQIKINNNNNLWTLCSEIFEIIFLLLDFLKI